MMQKREGYAANEIVTWSLVTSESYFTFSKELFQPHSDQKPHQHEPNKVHVSAGE